jgi:hypothetical protein
MKAFLILLALVLLGALAAHFAGVGREPTPFDGINSADPNVRECGIRCFPEDLARGELRPEVVAVTRRLLVDPNEDVRMAAADFAGRVGLHEVTVEVEAVARLAGFRYQPNTVQLALDRLRASR